MRVDFEQALAKIDPEILVATAIVGVGTSIFNIGWLTFHPRATLRALKREGVKGIAIEFVSNLKSAHERLVAYS